MMRFNNEEKNIYFFSTVLYYVLCFIMFALTSRRDLVVFSVYEWIADERSAVYIVAKSISDVGQNEVKKGVRVL